MSYSQLQVQHYEAIRKLLVAHGYYDLPEYVNYSMEFDFALKDFTLKTFGTPMHQFPIRMAELPRALVLAFGEDEATSQFPTNPTDGTAYATELVEELSHFYGADSEADVEVADKPADDEQVESVESGGTNDAEGTSERANEVDDSPAGDDENVETEEQIAEEQVKSPTEDTVAGSSQPPAAQVQEEQKGPPAKKVKLRTGKKS